jgi:hypothetical protein
MKTVTAMLLALGCAGFGLVLQAEPSKPDTPTDTPAPPGMTKRCADKAAAKVEDVVWGKDVDGLQAGLLLVAPDARPDQSGEKVTLEIRLRNVGKAAVKVSYGLPPIPVPTVTDAKGASVRVAMTPDVERFIKGSEKALKPGETMTLYKAEVLIEASPREGESGSKPEIRTPTISVSPGKYKIAFSGMVMSHSTLSTGTMEIEVQEPVTFDRNDANKSMKWFQARALAIREALENSNELAAKKLTDKIVNEVMNQKEIDWLVRVSHIGVEAITLDGVQVRDAKDPRLVQYGIYLLRPTKGRLLKDIFVAEREQVAKAAYGPDTDFQDLKKIPIPDGDWLLKLKKDDLVRVKGKPNDVYFSFDGSTSRRLWISLADIEVLPAEKK